MLTMQEKFCLWLNSFEGLYSAKQRALLACFGGNWLEFFEKFSQNYQLVEKHITAEQFAQMKSTLSKDTFDKLAQQLQERGIEVLTFLSEGYPDKLKNIFNPPTVLYLKGDRSLLYAPSIAVLGSRKCSSYGRRVTGHFVTALCQKLSIVSGLALGIDAEAHSTTLAQRGKTVAVLGCGFNHIYPPQHRDLFGKIAQDGLLVTEFSPHVKPQAFHFPMRNRLITAISDSLLVVEAGEKSGTFTSVEHALEQGKTVYAVPNDIFSFSSKGTNNLLKSLQGALVTCPEDILQEFDIKQDGENSTPVQLSIEEQGIVQVLRGGKAHFNDIVVQTRMSVVDTQVLLSEMELCGLVQRLEGNFYLLTLNS